MATKIEQLIINSPYREPSRYHQYNSQTREYELQTGRRPASYLLMNTQQSQPTEIPIELANDIRARLKRWQQNNRPGLTSISRQLLDYWMTDNRSEPLFYCQLEAIETLMFLTESDKGDYQVGLEIGDDGGSEFARWCTKMATGTGKTIVMAMIIAWNILNKVTYPNNPKFSKNILIIAPNLTVKDRLNVLKPNQDRTNYYHTFDLVPDNLKSKLYRGAKEGIVEILNWHMLARKTKQPSRVLKIGKESYERFTRRILNDLSTARNLIVINDEAHHAWRPLANQSPRDEETKQATIWMQGLDIIHQRRSILRCFDLTATPFRPQNQSNNKTDLLFSWVVSDFGLNDAIEAGLVKTPRMVNSTNASQIDYATLKPQLFHIYGDDTVRDNLNKKMPVLAILPDLVRRAYELLAADWQMVNARRQANGQITPAVMISICNETRTAERIEANFRNKNLGAEGLWDASTLLRIDSDILSKAESKLEADTGQYTEKANDPQQRLREHLENIIQANPSLTDEQREALLSLKNEELLRKIANTVGKTEEAGEQIRHVIAVAMLSEGWDTKNVTHIMGLRAFTSQLLCEQVIGRGLRRTNYTPDKQSGFFQPEYVTVFGVPFHFLPIEDHGKEPPAEQPSVDVQVKPDSSKYEISWPNVERIETTLKANVPIDVNQIEVLELDASKIPTQAKVVGVIAPEPVANMSPHTIQVFHQNYRLQTIIFNGASAVIEELAPQWQATRLDILPKVITLIDEFIQTGKLKIVALNDPSPEKERAVIMANLYQVAQHILRAIESECEAIETTQLVFNAEKVEQSTANMTTWSTSKPVYETKKSQINYAVIDSKPEEQVSQQLDDEGGIGRYVQAWVKNTARVNFYAEYLWQGTTHKYLPDFLIKLNNGVILVLEVKGWKAPDVAVKAEYLQRWVDAVNKDGRFGQWASDIIYDSQDLAKTINKYCPLH